MVRQCCNEAVWIVRYAFPKIFVLEVDVAVSLRLKSFPSQETSRSDEDPEAMPQACG